MNPRLLAPVLLVIPLVTSAESVQPTTNASGVSPASLPPTGNILIAALVVLLLLILGVLHRWRATNRAFGNRGDDPSSTGADSQGRP